MSYLENVWTHLKAAFSDLTQQQQKKYQSKFEDAHKKTILFLTEKSMP